MIDALTDEFMDKLNKTAALMIKQKYTLLLKPDLLANALKEQWDYMK